MYIKLAATILGCHGCLQGFCYATSRIFRVVARVLVCNWLNVLCGCHGFCYTTGSVFLVVANTISRMFWVVAKVLLCGCLVSQVKRALKSNICDILVSRFQCEFRSAR